MKQINSSRHLFFSLVFSNLVTSFMLYANFDDNDCELAIDEKRYSDALTILKNKPEENGQYPKRIINILGCCNANQFNGMA